MLNYRSHVLQAALNPIELDQRQVDAVAARIELDLRLGAAFTRFQTLSLQNMGPELADRVISYGEITFLLTTALLNCKSTYTIKDHVSFPHWASWLTDIFGSKILYRNSSGV